MGDSPNNSIASKKLKVTELYLRVKDLALFAEETTPDYKSFLQPTLEINRAFDHFNRASSVELGIKTIEKPEAYIEDSLDKAIGHLYRAFFDVADWLSINLREAILKEFSDFSHKSIQAVIPEYYQEIIPSIERVSKEIAGLRNDKDVKATDTYSQMDAYEKILKELHEQITNVRGKKGGVVDCEKRLEREKLKKLIINILLIIMAAILGVLGTLLIT